MPAVKIFIFPRSKSGIFDLILNKLKRFETDSIILNLLEKNEDTSEKRPSEAR